MHSPHYLLPFLIVLEHLEVTLAAQIQHTGSCTTMAAANHTMYGCHVTLATSVTSLKAVQKAPILAIVLTSLHTVGWALIFEKNVGSLQFSKSHFSSSSLNHCALVCCVEDAQAVSQAVELTTETRLETLAPMKLCKCMAAVTAYRWIMVNLSILRSSTRVYRILSVCWIGRGVTHTQASFNTMRYKGRDSASGIDRKLSIIRPGATTIVAS
jgi:hypothetical protein